MKLVYICGPIRRGDIWHNVGQADDAMLKLMTAGFSVINPMLSCWAGAAWYGTPASPAPIAHSRFQGVKAEVWLEMDLEMVRRCDCVLRLPGESEGADGEVECARNVGLPVYYDIQELITNEAH